MTVNVDTIQGLGTGKPGAFGGVAQRLLASNMDIKGLRTLDVLRKDEWIMLDTKIVEVARVALGAVGDLMSRGLSFNLPNAMGTTQLQYQRVSDFTAASVNMSGIAEAENDRAVFELATLPIPIVHKDFNINLRTLEASRRGGMPLDTTQAEFAGRVVSEKIEEMLFDGVTIGVPGGTNVLGYTNATNRNTGSLTARWDTTTGENIVADVVAMVSALSGDNMRGPYLLYVPVDYYVALGKDYKANSDKTILQRIKEIPGILDVRATSYLTGGASGEVVLAQMTSDVVDMINGIQPTTVMWESHGGMVLNFKVLAIMVPRVKWDYNSQSGIAHYSV